MKKMNPVVKKETLSISLWTLILSVIMQCVFLIIGKWDWRVMTGNLLGAGSAVLNFYLMCLGVVSAVNKADEKDAKTVIRMSQSLRMLMLLLIAVLGVALPYFNKWSVLISLFFPRIAVMFRAAFIKKNEKESLKKDGDDIIE